MARMREICVQCGKKVGGKKVSKADKLFCCLACCGKWEKGHKPKVCEFC